MTIENSLTVALITRLLSRGLSQCELERRSGVPQSRISRWNAGKGATSTDDVLKLAALDQKLAEEEAAMPKATQE